MLTFTTPGVADKVWIDPLLALEPTRACEYNFNNIYLWGKPFYKMIARCGDRLVMRLWDGPEVCYLYPVGRGPVAPVLEEMSADASSHGASLRMICLTQEFCHRLEQEVPGRFIFQSDNKGYDYIYGVDKLADLAGKKLHAKRNHINRFNENYPDWMFEPLRPGNLSECQEMNEAWFSQRGQKVEGEEKNMLEDENNSLQNALKNFDALGLEGGLIRAGGRVVAFTMGDRLGEDCFDVHFEKAFDHIQGAYPIINREFARYIRDKYPEVKWFNREDDVGLEGLRKAKMSYYPDILVKKFTAVTC